MTAARCIVLTKDDVQIDQNGTRFEWDPSSHQVELGDKLELDSIVFTGRELDLYGLRYIARSNGSSWCRNKPEFIVGRDYVICIMPDNGEDYRYDGQSIDFNLYNCQWTPVSCNLRCDHIEIRMCATKKD
jgi:hypothetical protein